MHKKKHFHSSGSSSSKPSSSSSSSSSFSSSSSSSSSPSFSSRKEKINKFGCCKCCNQPNTHKDWCHSCNSARFNKDFDKWTSGNEAVDNFIKNAQLNAVNHRQVLEWIPYDQFDRVELIGRGGFATVHSAIWKCGFINKWNEMENKWDRTRGWKDGMNGWKVALKVLDNSSDLSFDFFQEIKACVECGGGFGLIRCYGISRDPKTKNYIIVLYLAHRGSLRTYLDKHYGELDWVKKIGILKQVAEGLNGIHKAGYVHRDFHSGNILQSNCTEIADLGFSGPVNKKLPSSETREVYGVLPYVAPEVIRGKPYTFESDIYSFGIVMWDVLMCQLPFYDRAHDVHLAVDICNGLRPGIPEGTPDAFVELIEKCWNQDPKIRPTAHRIYEDLHKWYWDLRDGVVNEITLQFKLANENHLRTVSSSICSRYTTGTHPLAIYTSRLLSFPILSGPIVLSPSRRDSYQKPDFNTKKIGLEEISEVTFKPDEEEEYVTRQYDIDIDTNPDPDLQEDD